MMEQALAGHRDAADDIAMMDTLAVLGMVYTLLGRPEDAVAVAQECARACADRGESFSQAYALYVLGWNAWVQRDTARAKALLRDSLRLKGDLDDRLGIALALEVLTWTVAAEGDLESASRLLGAVDALWQSTGAPLAHMEPMVGDRLECETSIGALGETSSKLRAAGGRLTISEVITYAAAEEPQVVDDEADEPSLHPLTKREAEIARLVAKGMSNKSIAAELVIAQRTAEGHVERILNKLGFSSRTQIATWVAERARPERAEAGRH